MSLTGTLADGTPPEPAEPVAWVRPTTPPLTLDKRQYAPAVVVSRCPRCSVAVERDLSYAHYLSHPVIGERAPVYFIHFCDGEDADPVEWQVDVVVSMAVALAPVETAEPAAWVPPDDEQIGPADAVSSVNRACADGRDAIAALCSRRYPDARRLMASAMDALAGATRQLNALMMIRHRSKTSDCHRNRA